GAHGSDAHQAIAPDMGDRAASGANGVDIDRWQPHGEAGDAAAERHLRPAVAHEAHVRRSTAHVEGDEVAPTGAPTDGHGAVNAAAAGPWAASTAQHQPSRRLADADATNRRVPYYRRIEPAHVTAGNRLQKSVEPGGGETLVLAELRLYPAGQRHVDIGQRLP